MIVNRFLFLTNFSLLHALTVLWSCWLFDLKNLTFKMFLEQFVYFKEQNQAKWLLVVVSKFHLKSCPKLILSSFTHVLLLLLLTTPPFTYQTRNNCKTLPTSRNSYHADCRLANSLKLPKCDNVLILKNKCTLKAKKI